jgi:lipoprotein-anchoring transpeptidase ErfK/SrfK
MHAAADSTRAAVTAARAANAGTWAPGQLMAAEQAWRDALTAQRVEETRLWPVPDAPRVASAFASAEHAAEAALVAARDGQATASRTATASIDEANTAVEASETLASSVALGSDRRALVSQARAALAEARVYAREADFGRAIASAQQAIALAAEVRDHAAAAADRYADAGTLARWRQWKEETIAWSRRESRPAIVVAKEPHTMTLYVGGRAVRTYHVDLGFNWVADKAQAGDGATPEGRYRVVARLGDGASRYYKALLLDYPNAQDRAEYAQARRHGRIPASAAIGGLIEIHGEGGRGRDWTNGCVAVTNADMDDVFARVGIGTPVTIVGNDTYAALAELAAQRRTSTVVDGPRP